MAHRKHPIRDRRISDDQGILRAVLLAIGVLTVGAMGVHADEPRRPRKPPGCLGMLPRKRHQFNRCWFGTVWLLGFALVPVLTEAQERIYFSSIDTIDRANLDGSNLETIFSQSGTAPFALALDLDARRLYWSEPGALEIKRATLFGQNVEVLVTGARTWGLALDPANDLMYWSNDVGDVFPPGVYRSAMDGTNPDLVIPSNGSGIRAVALDNVHSRIYWTARTAVTYLLLRANLDGSGAETIVEVSNDHEAVALTLDVADDRIYWSELDVFPGLTGGSIARSRLDGSAMETLFEPVRAWGLSLDLPRGHLYWISDDHTLQRANLDGSNRVVMDLGVTNLRGIAIDTRPAVPIPAVSAWALLSLSLALSAAGTIVLRRPRCR